MRLYSLECQHVIYEPPYRVAQKPVLSKECRECGEIERMKGPRCRPYWLAYTGGSRSTIVRVSADGFVQAEADIERSGRHKLNKWALAWAPDLRSATEDLWKGRVQWYVRCRCGEGVPLSVAN